MKADGPGQPRSSRPDDQLVALHLAEEHHRREVGQVLERQRLQQPSAQNGGSRSSGNMWPETKKFSVLTMYRNERHFQEPEADHADARLEEEADQEAEQQRHDVGRRTSARRGSRRSSRGRGRTAGRRAGPT